MNTRHTLICSLLAPPAKKSSPSSILGLELAVTPDSDLHQEVMKAFHQAKNTGHELDVTFSYRSSKHAHREQVVLSHALGPPSEPLAKGEPSAEHDQTHGHSDWVR